MCILQHYRIPLTLATFVNYYGHLNLLRLSNHVLWVNNRTTTPMLAARVASSWTYVVTLGYSSSMVGHLVTN
jgi:hypothetical protein